MSVFVATSKRFYEEAKQIVQSLRESGVKVYHPYFDLDPLMVDADPEFKSAVTLKHFPEIEDSDMIYALLPEGYIGCSVTIEIAYAYAKGKKIYVSEKPCEFAVMAMVTQVCSPEKFLACFDRRKS